MKDFFTIIGGMGTQATECYIHLINKLTPAHKDQDYLNYILINNATIPDRTNYILNHNNPNPLIPLLSDIKQQNQLNPEFYVIPCNTAHYFYNKINKIANAPVLHMPKETISAISKKFPHVKRIGLIATKGTIKDKIYDMQVNRYNKLHTHHTFMLVKPTNNIENQVMHLIYHDVKDNNFSNPTLYCQILSEMFLDEKCDVVILGCTELSLVQERCYKYLMQHYTDMSNDFSRIDIFDINHVIDAQKVLAENTVKEALKLQK